MGKTTNPTGPTRFRRKFSGKGYVPKLYPRHFGKRDLEASERFYREVLGLEVVKLWPSFVISNTATPGTSLYSGFKQTASILLAISVYSGGRFADAVQSLQSFEANRGLGKSNLEKAEASAEESFSSAISTATGGKLRAQERSQSPDTMAPPRRRIVKLSPPCRIVATMPPM
jgi:hypothetical protein